jgi:hypothetical protein
MTSASHLKNWVPIRLYKRDSAVRVDWCDMADDRFTHPFFLDTIRQRMRYPFNLVFRHQTSVDTLREVAESSDTIPPTGFIFHMSRCGSTLVAQMLAASSANVVISEAPPIEAAVREERDLLRWMVTALGRRRWPEERRYFIKFDSWNTLDLAAIKDAFPDVPWIFLYRDPVEVIVSQMRQRGSHMVPGTIEGILPDVTPDEIRRMQPEEYCARVLGRVCAVALEHAGDDRALLVNYDELPGAVTSKIARHFDLDLTRDELDQMQHAAEFNSKTPQMYFEPDSLRKRSEATASILRAEDSWVRPVYDRLEHVRRERSE